MNALTVRLARTPLLAIFLASLSLMAQAGTVSGKITTASSEAIPNAEVFLLSINRSARSDENGFYQLQDVPEGSYQLKIRTENWGTKVTDVEVTSGNTTEFNVVFDLRIHEEFVVSATPKLKSISDIAQAVSVFNEQDMLEKTEPTLGATLDKEPGVHSTYFGPGAGRPVIRGLGGDRIRILEGGLGTGDASTVSADHAISTDMLTTQRIEVLRGPAALRYGSNAVGGAINIIDNRIPEFLPEKPLSGEVELRGNTVADERAGAFLLNGALGDFAWHVDFATRDTDDYEIPGEPALEEEHSEDEEEEAHGDTLENSDLTSDKGSVGFSIIKDRGFFGASFTQFDTNYGISGEGHGHGEEEEEHMEGEEEEEEEEIIRIDMEQKRIDLRGGFQLGSEVFQNLNLRFGQTDYEHVELESGEIGTRFFNEAQEARLELVQGELGPFSSGSIGLNYQTRDFEAIGEEAFVPPNETDRLALFVYQEIDRETWNFSAGIRFEDQTSDGSFSEHAHEEEEEHMDGEEEEEEEVEEISRDFSGVSGSLGFVAFKDKPLSLALNLTQTERAPTPEELFSNGPHLATQSFEVGSPDLTEETSLGANVSLRRTTGRVTGEISIFTNQFSDFIYQRNTGEIEDGLPEFEFAQQDADFHGGEIHIDAELFHSDPHHVNLELTADLVRAELDNGENLPRISPNRYRADLGYHRDSLWVTTSITRTSSQDRTAPLETSTSGFSILDVSAGYRFLAAGLSHQLILRGTNLTDEEGRVHTSFLKDQILLPGRNISLAYRLLF